MTDMNAAVLGAGSWGTALAKLLADQGIRTRLWARRAPMAEAIQSDRENRAYLPGFELPQSLEATADLAFALQDSDLVVCVVPTHGLRDVITEAIPHFNDRAPIVSATKGIENETLMLVSEVFEDLLPKGQHRLLAYLGGPSFAKEVAAGAPTAVSVAAYDAQTAEEVQKSFNTERFRVYRTDDVVGVELGGSLKNVIAIGAGIADGLDFGHNARAGLITRGLAEISRLAIARGANPLTLAGLSGMGDLVLTCTGDLSRNRNVGLQLGRGKSLQEIVGNMQMVAEGVRTTKSAYQLAQREGVEMPIVQEVYAMLYEQKPPRQAVYDLMTRPLRAERE